MKINKKQKELIVIFVGIFLFTFVILNWDQVSWMFNYQEVSGLAYDFFNPYQSSDLLASANSTQAPHNQNALVATQPVVAAAVYPYSDKSNSLEIPALNVATPVVIGESTDKTVLEHDLDKGAVYYPGSVLPAEKGQIVILGHSAPPNWPHIKHDYIFSDINNLTIGDQIILYFNNTQYTYLVTQKNIIAQGQDISSVAVSSNNNDLTLVSCWPPGKNYKRITVTAELQKP
jgi:LPXTG-site transpeptidase (sortase) family protein